ncbi:UvrD-helicase domain-containing protein [Candidatus Kaiserbacteria bacterium]|nr:UvrD-helicase domain-containing protein [Candidatus Kaiserbacteria bacterium]
MEHSFDSLEGLNERQKEAVLATEGPLLVLAGAGSGKTRVITHRILHLIEKGIAPQNILAVTFTNKAAREMRERMRALLSNLSPSALAVSRAAYDALPLLTTFHSLGVRILREHHGLLGLRRHFAIYDRSDSTKAIKRALDESGYGPKEFEPRRMLSIISHAKGNAMTRDSFGEATRSYVEEAAAVVWERYEHILKEEQALDFDDLLLKTLRLLENHPETKAHYRSLFRYIHIDEYQDTNKVQYEIARALAGEIPNICVVGDADQNIYSWRGADISNILQFERHFPGAKTILLEENYRSTQTIIAASNTIIEKNRNRIPKTVFTSNAEGEPIGLYVGYNQDEEANFVATTAQTLIGQGASASGIAVLFRTNFQSRALEEAFLGLGVPYQVLGVRFFERKEIKDVLSFLRLALNPDSTGDLARVINVPPRGIGKITLLKLIEKNRNGLNASAVAKVAEFDAMMKEIGEYARTKPLAETLRFIMKRTGMEDLLKKGGEEELERLENLRELVSLGAQYDNSLRRPADGGSPEEAVEQLLEDAALQTDQDELKNAKGDEDAVKLMTIHAAKGLEFQYVFITGLEEGLFPHERLAIDDPSGPRTDEEEERRLFYVALTRAQKKVYLTYAALRTIFGSQRVSMPSSFLADLKEEHIEECNPLPAGGAGGGLLSGFERTIYID